MPYTETKFFGMIRVDEETTEERNAVMDVLWSKQLKRQAKYDRKPTEKNLRKLKNARNVRLNLTATPLEVRYFFLGKEVHSVADGLGVLFSYPHTEFPFLQKLSSNFMSEVWNRGRAIFEEPTPRKTLVDKLRAATTSPRPQLVTV